ncbi:MAG: hypothetical protein GX809_04770 [Clostridiaceae bacterium]|jgi:hypothetical protein|nr:hypothetical protein [Clostridiaceae bacterium]
MTISFPSLPENLDQFMPLAEDMMKEPQGTAALLIVALGLYVKEREAGLAALNVLHGPRPLSVRDQQFIRDRLMDKPYLPDSYFVGARPDNNYTPDQPWTLEIQPDPIPAESDEFRRLRLNSSGADSPRLVTLRRKASGDTWFLWDYPGIVTGIRLPSEQDPWA